MNDDWELVSETFDRSVYVIVQGEYKYSLVFRKVSIDNPIAGWYWIICDGQIAVSSCSLSTTKDVCIKHLELYSAKIRRLFK
jgi:hypothetical protein